MKGDLDTLRAFRDRWLSSNALGRAITTVYYSYSPAIASYLEAHTVARVLVRFALVPLVYGIKYPWAVTALMFLFFWWRRPRRREAQAGIAVVA